MPSGIDHVWKVHDTQAELADPFFAHTRKNSGSAATFAPPASHPVRESLNRLLKDCRFDEFVESMFAPSYAGPLGRFSLEPGMYFRTVLVGYFEGTDRERSIAWRAADSLGIRAFTGNRAG